MCFFPYGWVALGLLTLCANAQTDGARLRGSTIERTCVTCLKGSSSSAPCVPWKTTQGRICSKGSRSTLRYPIPGSAW